MARVSLAVGTSANQAGVRKGPNYAWGFSVMKVLTHPDVELEAQIDEAYERFIAAPDARRRAAWNAFTALLAKRSPTRIKRMERDQGIDKRATFEPRSTR
jgi:hypothetical protein